jgi:hypothetical protein
VSRLRRWSRTPAATWIVAGVAVPVALLAALAAHDVRSWRDTLHVDAARYATRPTAGQTWTAPTVFPAALSGRALAVARDRRWLSALRLYALTRQIQIDSEAGISARDERLLQTAEKSLSYLTRDPDPARAAQAYDLMGALLFEDAKGSIAPDLATYAAAVAAMQNAVRVDGTNERAKADLELILRQQLVDSTQANAVQPGDQGSNHGRQAGRGKGVPPASAPGGDY